VRGMKHALRFGVGISLWMAACVAPSPVREVDVEALPALAAFEHSESGEALDILLKSEFSAPTHLRPCCAFGHDLQVDLSILPVPLVVLSNVVDPEDVGHHGYDGGYLSLEHGIDNAFVSGEENGLVYSCRGGFIDLAHVRDYADWTAFLARRLRATLPTGAAIELPEEGARRFVFATAIDRDRIARVGPGLPAQLAQWIAFHLSLWHETVTWYGWTSVPLFPERASAFSPEDLYSNLLGTQLASYIVQSGVAEDEAGYEAAMDRAIAESLGALGALPPETTERALDAVDGLWWDSRVSVPGDRLLLRRNFSAGPEIVPWQVPESRVTPQLERDLAKHCKDVGTEPAVLRIPDEVEGVPFDRLVRLDYRADDPLLGELPLPEPSSPWLSQSDLPAILEDVARESRAEFGRDHDLPRESRTRR
jgi:hypothetical protein